MIAVARGVEALGYDSLWTASHTVIPARFQSRYPYSADGRPPWNATTEWGDTVSGLGLAAAVTERVRLGTSVVPLTTADPLTLAKQSATLDVLSNGRFELGIGAGWLVEEAAALGRPTDHRSARLEETVEILRLAWTKETFAYSGRYYAFSEVGSHPHPPQGGALPIWIGGSGPRAVEIVATHGCGLMLWLADPAKVREYADRLRARGSSAPLAVAMPLRTHEGRWLALAQEFEAAGVSLLILIQYARPRITEALEEFASEVLTRIG